MFEKIEMSPLRVVFPEQALLAEKLADLVLNKSLLSPSRREAVDTTVWASSVAMVTAKPSVLHILDRLSSSDDFWDNRFVGTCQSSLHLGRPWRKVKDLTKGRLFR